MAEHLIRTSTSTVEAMATRLTFCLLVLGLAKEKVIFFKAFLPKETEYEVKSTIVYSDVKHNIGGGYNPSTGVFRAPVTGLYEFKCRVTRTTGEAAEIVLFNDNRPRAGTTFMKDWETYGISTVMRAEKGDHVSAVVYWSVGKNPVTLRSGYFNQFSGYLIRQV